MSDPDKGIEWLEANIDNAIEGLNHIVTKMYDQLRIPERLSMVLLLRRDGRKHLAEISEELPLSRKLVAHHEKVLEKWDIVSSKLDKAPRGYAAELVRYVKLTPIGENMMRCLEAEEEEVKQ